jgi:hypothetical protein
MDKLEKQITDYRGDLDRLTPDPQIWERIQDDQNKIRSQRLRSLSGWAALFIILITGALVLSGTGNVIQGKKSNELTETESYYSVKFNTLINEAKPMLIEYPGLSEDLMMELDNLDSLYFEIKKDLRDNVSNDEVIDALILNYKTKIRILEEMLRILGEENTNVENKESYEI